MSGATPGAWLEQTSAATHHVHVPASALTGPSRQVARAALERALARTFSPR